jgi:hypothetical protein
MKSLKTLCGEGGIRSKDWSDDEVHIAERECLIIGLDEGFMS